MNNRLIITTSSFQFSNFFEYKALNDAGFKIDINPYGRRLTEFEIFELIDETVVGVVAGVEPWSKSIFEKAKSLKIISRCGVGLDNIDMAAAREYGVRVFNTPDAPTDAAAELTIAHILSLCRRIPESDRALRSGEWKPLMGRQLSEQTVGIIGCGRIGSKVEKLLVGFGTKILKCDIESVASRSKNAFVDMEYLLCNSDIVTLHVPLTQETRHIINANTISKMKSSALLVNVARGGLIEENALLSAIVDGRIEGAALDCFEEEPYSGPLLSCERVQLTAHMGSYAQEVRSKMETDASEALVRGLKEYGLY